MSSPSTDGTPTRSPTRRTPATFERSKLKWDEIDDGEHGRLRRLYQELISLRHSEPDLADPWLDHLHIDYDEDLRWIVMRRGSLAIACNLGADPVDVPVTGEVVLAWGEPERRRENYSPTRAFVCNPAACHTNLSGGVHHRPLT